MHIKFSPVRLDSQLQAFVEGDCLVLNDQRYDFSPLKDGDILPKEAIDCPWVAGDVYREGGDIHISLVLPHGIDAPYETRFPAPVVCQSGVIPFPPYGGV